MEVRTRDGRVLHASRVYKRRKVDYKQVRILCLGDGSLVEPGSPEADLSLVRATPEEEGELAEWGFRLPHAEDFSDQPTPKPPPRRMTWDEFRENPPDIVVSFSIRGPDGKASRPMPSTLVDPRDLPRYEGVPHLAAAQAEALLSFLDRHIHISWGNKTSADEREGAQPPYAFKLEALAYESVRKMLLDLLRENGPFTVKE